jgi:pimeloyl-ACP methyl ester carboxylesterase
MSVGVRAFWFVLAVIFAGCSSTSVSEHNPLEQHVAIDSLNDVRFSSAHIREGVWSPEEFARAARGGIFFVDPPVPGRTVVLFIHGINGSPRDFRFLIAHLDRNRFQACVFFYASGSSLSRTGRELSEDLGELHRRHEITSVVIVAHSVGGLIARDLVLNRSAHAGVQIPLLFTLSSPWGGSPSAGFGVRWSPVVVDSWRDIAAGSAYLHSLFVDAAGSPRDLPRSTRHYLLFSYRKRWPSFGLSGDAVTSVASQLFGAAQAQAYRVYGFDVSHSEILRNDSVAELLDETLRSLSSASAEVGS